MKFLKFLTNKGKSRQIKTAETVDTTINIIPIKAVVYGIKAKGD